MRLLCRGIAAGKELPAQISVQLKKSNDDERGRFLGSGRRGAQRSVPGRAAEDALAVIRWRLQLNCQSFGRSVVSVGVRRFHGGYYRLDYREH
ncbi:hypothetical protein M8818_003012 [Zalaria obscura]|uniref:Uncharacterized protein n=1 Tax=Zalaria obscura TaxID=2024903 RepID=A0ACC3SGQ1_9PEZI